MRPGPGSAPAAAVGITHHGWRAQVALQRTTLDLVLVGDASGIITPGALRSSSVTLDLGRVLAGTPGRPSLALLALVSRRGWSFPRFDDPGRTRWGAGVALEATVPLSGRWSGITRGELGFSGSLFDAPELPSDFDRRGARRIAAMIGVRWRIGGQS
jgi:hypothetical protein